MARKNTFNVKFLFVHNSNFNHHHKSLNTITDHYLCNANVCLLLFLFTKKV